MADLLARLTATSLGDRAEDFLASLDESQLAELSPLADSNLIVAVGMLLRTRQDVARAAAQQAIDDARAEKRRVRAELEATFAATRDKEYQQFLDDEAAQEEEAGG